MYILINVVLRVLRVVIHLKDVVSFVLHVLRAVTQS